MRKYITEFVGTFFLVATVGFAVIGGAGNMAPLAIGSVLLAMVFAGAHISGAHYNPAVTLAVLLRGRMKLSEAVGYWIVQIIAAAAAGMVVNYMLSDKIAGTAVIIPDATRAIIAEFIGTFALAYVVLNVATAKGTVGNMFYGLAIGFTVLAMAYALGSFSGGAFNPAVATGLFVMHLASFSDWWIFAIGCFGGAGAAALVFRINNPEDK